ncbi:hypothetical protein [Streptomyces halobius]|uniref:Small secreted domain DUF320 n=1 Tax=Streptomyces halobius TaxID=2879846 RepID=A0ABY4MBG5_9ACTN|nr:hypothetical protein [Streptomyces halobius]UQA95033.1 hypothetical protein K9S39_27090 [Streptomyces halobius]
MRKLRKAAVVAAVLGSVGFLGAGTAVADGHGGHGHKDGTRIGLSQGNHCRSHDINVNILGEVGLVNGLLGGALGGEGSPGAQSTPMGSELGCNNAADFGQHQKKKH